MDAKTSVLCVVAPAGAMGAGALLQQLLISAWPDVQNILVHGVGLDSYLADAAIAGLCFWAGTLIKRSAPPKGVLIASFLFPFIWLVALLLLISPPNHMSATVRAAFLVAALAPVLSLAVAYALPSRMPLSGPGR